MTIAQSKHALEEGEALLMLIKGEVFNPLACNSSADVWIFLDPGSTRSFISQRLADELGLVTQNTDYVNLIGFNEPDGRMYESNIVTFGIKLRNEQAINMQASCMPMIVRDLNTVLLSGNSKASFMSSRHKAVTPDILIGIDHYFDLEVTKTDVKVDGFTVLETLLGPLVCGTSASSQNRTTVDATTTLSLRDDSQTLEQMIESHSKLEIVELNKESIETPTDYNQLWNKESTSPRINFKEAQGRLKILLRKFKMNPQHFSLYTETKYGQLIIGIIERDENPFRSVRLIQIGYDRGAKYLTAHSSLALILLFLSIMALITSAMQADHNTSTQKNRISAYALQRQIRYRIKYRHTLWIGNPKQSERRPRTMVGPWMKFRRPDGIFCLQSVAIYQSKFRSQPPILIGD